MPDGDAVDDRLTVTFGKDDLLGVGQVERHVERAAVGLAVRPEKDVLAGLDLGLQVTAGNGVLLQIGGIVGKEASCDVHRAVGGVEELDPGVLLSEVVLEVIGIDHQVLVQAHRILALRSCREAQYQTGNRQKQFEMFHTMGV